MEVLTCQKVLNSNRISVSEQVRDALQIKVGDFVKFVSVDGKIYIEKVEATG